MSTNKKVDSGAPSWALPQFNFRREVMRKGEIGIINTNNGNYPPKMILKQEMFESREEFVGRILKEVEKVDK